jgi:ectoine hydroxylase-related dioxygenase (phytanoyl-CoA dioxygenase family)
MKSIFKNKEQQLQFEKEGYLIIPILDESEVVQLANYYQSLNLKNDKEYGFHVSMDRLDKDLCKQVQTNILDIILPKLDNYLENYKAFVANYIIKETYSLGFVPAHQDWSFVDKEDEGYCSITCWTALVDTNIDNGCMSVIKGSNTFIKNIRPSPSPQIPNTLSEHKFSIFPYFKTLDMKAGETLFFDSRTFHASPPNTTSESRLVASVGITQKDADLVHYYLKPDGKKNTILKYKVDEEFFLKYYNARLSIMYQQGEIITDYKIVEEINYLVENLTFEEMKNMILQAGNKYNLPLCEKLAVLFNEDINLSKNKETKVEVKEVKVADELPLNEAWTDNRTLFEKYTPLNILREIKFRITGK